MADGDMLMIDQHRWAVKLLDAHNTASAGPWVEVPAWYNIRSVHCNTVGTDTVNIEVSNAISQPSSTTSGVVTMALTGTTGAKTNVESFRWIRAVKTGTAQTTTCILEAARNE